MYVRPGPVSPRSSFATVAIILGMIVLPAALTLGRVRVPAVVDVAAPNPSPYGYTVSLLLFLVPILAVGGWLVPRDDVKISKKSFVRTIALLFPLGVVLDFFFAHLFLKFPNVNATLRIPAPALGNGGSGHIFVGSPNHIIVGSVPIEEYVFYLTGFVTVLLLYIWLDEYWLAAYSIPGDDPIRGAFQRLLRFHPESLISAVILIGAAILYRHLFLPSLPGFPGYFTFLVIAALGLLRSFLSGCTSGNQLARILAHLVYYSACERVVGSNFRGSIRLVGLPTCSDDGPEYNRMELPANRSNLCLDRCHLSNHHRLRSRQALAVLREETAPRLTGMMRLPSVGASVVAEKRRYPRTGKYRRSTHETLPSLSYFPASGDGVCPIARRQHAFL